MNRELSHREMQEMLPDYIFGSLNAEESEAFEANLNKYPDILKETHDAGEVFSKIDRLEIDNDTSRRTRNLNLKVKEKLSKRKKGMSAGPLYRLVMPGAALLFVVAIVFITYFKNDDMPAQSAEVQTELFSETEIVMINSLIPPETAYNELPVIIDESGLPEASLLAPDTEDIYLAEMNILAEDNADEDIKNLLNEIKLETIINEFEENNLEIIIEVAQNV
ncbi:MAG: hypothetical protein ACOC4D_01470, partial [Bacteroidota bacterium]